MVFQNLFPLFTPLVLIGHVCVFDGIDRYISLVLSHDAYYEVKGISEGEEQELTGFIECICPIPVLDIPVKQIW